MVDELDRLVGACPVPAQAWRIAGIEYDPAVKTLADCTVVQLEAFAGIVAVTGTGKHFVDNARQVRDIFYRVAGEQAIPCPPNLSAMPERVVP